VVTRHQEVAPARLSIQSMAEDLHRAARRFRLYLARPVAAATAGAVLPLLERTADQVRDWLKEDRPPGRRS
jgi:hypothetical protein